MSSLSCGTLYSTIRFVLFFNFNTAYSYVLNISSVQFWWFGGRVIPDLIPNSAVKPPSGDGTHRNRWGE